MAGLEQTICPNHKKIMPVHCGSLSAQILRCSYLWTIKNFSLYSNKVGDFVESPKFFDEENRNVKWLLRLYPNGESEEECGFLSLYLYLCEPDVESAFVKCTISLCDSNHKNLRENKTFVFEYSSKLFSWGHPKLVQRNGLLNTENGILPDDELVIVCAVSAVFGAVVNNVESPFYNKEQSWTCRDLFENEKFTDVVLRVDGWEIRAHAVILASQSPLFLDMFEEGIRDVDIMDFKYETIRALLHYAYTNEMPVLNVDNAKELFAASDSYAFCRLNSYCEDYLSSNMTVDTAVDVLYLAHTHGAEDLTKHCLDFVCVHAKEVYGTASWKLLADREPKLLLDAFQAMAFHQASPKNKKYSPVTEFKLTYHWL